MHAIRQDVVILPGGRIEIVSPELTPGARAEAIVLEEATGTSQRAAKGRFARGRRSSAMRKGTEQPLSLRERRAFMKLPLQERRRILAEQAERMADLYKEDAEVAGLGGGDFLDC